MTECQRCGQEVEKLYPITFRDDFGLDQTILVCWDCDFEIMNGKGEPLDDEYEVMEQREEDEYYDDPINNSPPWLDKLTNSMETIG